MNDNKKKQQCVAHGCPNRIGSSASLHHFPLDRPDVCNIWTEFVKKKRAKWEGPTKWSILCGDHFEKSAYPLRYSILESIGQTPPKTKKLLPDAVPTVHEVPTRLATPRSTTRKPKKRRSAVFKGKKRQLNDKIIDAYDDEATTDNSDDGDYVPTISETSTLRKGTTRTYATRSLSFKKSNTKSIQTKVTPHTKEKRKPSYLFDDKNPDWAPSLKLGNGFPTDPALREEWLTQIHRKNWSPPLVARICSDHFDEEDIDRTGNTVEIRPHGVPTRFKMCGLPKTHNNAQEVRIEKNPPQQNKQKQQFGSETPVQKPKVKQARKKKWSRKKNSQQKRKQEAVCQNQENNPKVKRQKCDKGKWIHKIASPLNYIDHSSRYSDHNYLSKAKSSDAVTYMYITDSVAPMKEVYIENEVKVKQESCVNLYDNYDPLYIPQSHNLPISRERAEELHINSEHLEDLFIKNEPVEDECIKNELINEVYVSEPMKECIEARSMERCKLQSLEKSCMIAEQIEEPKAEFSEVYVSEPMKECIEARSMELCKLQSLEKSCMIADQIEEPKVEFSHVMEVDPLEPESHEKCIVPESIERKIESESLKGTNMIAETIARKIESEPLKEGSKIAKTIEGCMIRGLLEKMELESLKGIHKIAETIEGSVIKPVERIESELVEKSYESPEIVEVDSLEESKSELHGGEIRECTIALTESMKKSVESSKIVEVDPLEESKSEVHGGEIRECTIASTESMDKCVESSEIIEVDPLEQLQSESHPSECITADLFEDGVKPVEESEPLECLKVELNTVNRECGLSVPIEMQDRIVPLEEEWIEAVPMEQILSAGAGSMPEILNDDHLKLIQEMYTKSIQQCRENEQVNSGMERVNTGTQQVNEYNETERMNKFVEIQRVNECVELERVYVDECLGMEPVNIETERVNECVEINVNECIKMNANECVETERLNECIEINVNECAETKQLIGCVEKEPLNIEMLQLNETEGVNERREQMSIGMKPVNEYIQTKRVNKYIETEPLQKCLNTEARGVRRVEPGNRNTVTKLLKNVIREQIDKVNNADQLETLGVEGMETQGEVVRVDKVQTLGVVGVKSPQNLGVLRANLGGKCTNTDTLGGVIGVKSPQNLGVLRAEPVKEIVNTQLGGVFRTERVERNKNTKKLRESRVERIRKNKNTKKIRDSGIRGERVQENKNTEKLRDLRAERIKRRNKNAEKLGGLRDEGIERNKNTESLRTDEIERTDKNTEKLVGPGNSNTRTRRPGLFGKCKLLRDINDEELNRISELSERVNESNKNVAGIRVKAINDPTESLEGNENTESLRAEEIERKDKNTEKLCDPGKSNTRTRRPRLFRKCKLLRDTSDEVLNRISELSEQVNEFKTNVAGIRVKAVNDPTESLEGCIKSNYCKQLEGGRLMLAEEVEGYIVTETLQGGSVLIVKPLGRKIKSTQLEGRRIIMAEQMPSTNPPTPSEPLKQ